jgi:hypothetical protein
MFKYQNDYNSNYYDRGYMRNYNHQGYYTKGVIKNFKNRNINIKENKLKKETLEN